MIQNQQREIALPDLQFAALLTLIAVLSVLFWGAVIWLGMEGFHWLATELG